MDSRWFLMEEQRHKRVVRDDSLPYLELENWRHLIGSKFDDEEEHVSEMEDQDNQCIGPGDHIEATDLRATVGDELAAANLRTIFQNQIQKFVKESRRIQTKSHPHYH